MTEETMQDHGAIIWEEDSKGIKRRVCASRVQPGATVTVKTESGQSFTGTVFEANHEPTSSTWRRVELKVRTDADTGSYVAVITDGEVSFHEGGDIKGVSYGNLDEVRVD